MGEEGTDQIVNGAATQCVYILNYKVPKRDLAWGVAVTILGIVCFALIIVLAVQGGSGGTSDDGGDDKVVSSTCTNAACMASSAAFVRDMDATADPCKDFYQYTCGNFEATHHIAPDGNARGAVHDMSLTIEHALYRYLEQPIERVTANSYEVKLKNLFHSCMNEEITELRGGQPLIDAIEKAGGWNVFALKEGQSTTWDDYVTLMENSMTDLWVFPFMRFDVFPDPTNRNKRVMKIDPSGISMSQSWYLTDVSVQTQEAYKTYMRSVASQLLMDNDMPITEEVETAMENFVRDTYIIETQIAQIMQDTAADQGHPSHVMLNQLEPADGSNVDIIRLASELFKEAGVNSQSWVYAATSYVMNIDALVGDILYSQDGARKLNNYLVWRVMDQYSQTLSREYRLAKKDFLTEVTGTKEEWSRWIDCINIIKMHMPIALSATTVPEWKDKLDRNDIENMLMYTREAFNTQIQTQTYADEATSKLMMTKLNQLEMELYDDHDVVIQPTLTDQFYQRLMIHNGEFFQNVLFLNDFTKAKLNEILVSNNEDHPMFILPEYSILPRYSEIWNHLYVPLGSLNYPFYHKELPPQLKYGGLGHVLSLTTTNMINPTGSLYDLDGVLSPWWSMASYGEYQQLMACYYKLYNDTVFGPYDVDGPMLTVQIPSTVTAGEVINEIAGLRAAYIAFQEHMSRSDMKPVKLAGLDHDADQLFFLSFAHTLCVNKRDRWEYNLVSGMMIPEKFRANEVLSQMPEFQKAFQCAASSDMVQSTGCTPPL